MRELDMFLTNYLNSLDDSRDASKIKHFETFLDQSDQNLLDWLYQRVAPPQRFQNITTQIREQMKNREPLA